MREFREIDDIEEKLRISDRMTPEEAMEYVKKYNKSLEESRIEIVEIENESDVSRVTPEEASEYVRKFDKSLEELKIEKDEASSEVEYERTRREIREYIDAEEEFEKVMNDIMGDVDRVISDVGQNTQEEEHLESIEFLKEGKIIKFRTPQIRGQSIASLTELEDILREDFSWIYKREDNIQLLEPVKKYFDLIDAVRGKIRISSKEMKEIASQLGISTNLARKWAFFEQAPYLYRIVETGFSKSEAGNILKRIKLELGELNHWSVVEKRLNTKYPNKEYQLDSRFELRKKRSIQFFNFLEEFQDGGTIKGISRRTNIPERVVSMFVKEQIPWMIKDLFIPTILGRGRKREYKIHVEFPRVLGESVESIDELISMITWARPSLFIRDDFFDLLDTAKKHLSVIQNYVSSEHVSSWEIAKIAKETEISRTSIREYLVENTSPQLYQILTPRTSELLPLLDSSRLLQIFKEKLNGITSVENLEKRLETLYTSDELKISERSTRNSLSFFKLLQSLDEGINQIPTLAIKTGFSEGQIKYRCNNEIIPRFLTLAACIPSDLPIKGTKWLPLEITGTRMRKFIQVPDKIESSNDLIQVLEQLQPLNTHQYDLLSSQFGVNSSIDSFLYFLGMTISDGNIGGTKLGITTSLRMKLKLAKKYDWSNTVGDAYCYALGHIGFEAKRGKDEIGCSPNGTFSEMYKWQSTSSPFFVWIRKTLLGLDSSKAKSWVPIKADWILNMPTSWKIPFLQGISDGDASASCKGHALQIHTYTNQKFYKRLLASLGIASYTSTTYVGIGQKESIRLAEQLPMFRYASSRQENLSKLILMLDSHNWSRISDTEEAFILNLHNQGFRVGEIIERMWDELGRSRRRTTIYKVIERNNDDECGKRK